jgi:hypothetical protein
MFSRKQLGWIGSGVLFVALAMVCFATDPVENGFGTQSLYMAPLLMVTGFVLVIPGIAEPLIEVKMLLHKIKTAWSIHLGALFVFMTALTAYVLTLEPTASLWDCSEFIASSYKLQIPHTPGNPLLLVFGRIFSLLSLGDVSRIAWGINMMSAVFASLTVALVYYAILHLCNSKGTYAMIAAITGALCIAFSDTFWYSAVEAETYATSCFFIMLIVLLIMKGRSLREMQRTRMLVLILYLSGLAFCIHPMSALAIPLLPLAWMYPNEKVGFKTITISLALGIGIVLFINRFVAVGIFELAFYIDLAMVNGLSLPLYSGAFVLLLLLIIAFRLAISRLPSLQPYLYASIFFLLGFTPYLMLFIRSGHNPPIDESNPENLPLIKAYMNREGYPTRPLLIGPYFDAEVERVSTGKNVYYQDGDKYSIAGTIPEYHYTPERQTILPRIYSNDPGHVRVYRQWTNLREGERPGFADNIRFMLRYQLGHMYLRYILFNFAGRESDVQNSGWLKPWDREEGSSFTSKARNQYWTIPLLLGIIGIVFQYYKARKDLIVVGVFFLITGLVLAVYLNSTPNEPRERDYIYVGSYIAFSIWIGMGTFALLQLLPKTKLASLTVLPALAVPAMMCWQNYDDHDRSGRTFHIDSARNVLASCKPNSILFTGGDNDTFPLWYLQEVEGFRTDVRVMVLSYMNTDWYINQLRKRYYDSPAFNFTLTLDDYRQYGSNDVIYVNNQIKEGIDLKRYLQLLSKQHPALRMTSSSGAPYSVIPSKKVILNTSGAHDTPPTSLVLTENYLSKNGLAILDIISTNPERTVHFNFTSATQTGLNMEDYLVQEGQVFRYDPVKAADSTVDTETGYVNLVEKLDLSNLGENNVLVHHEDHQLRIVDPLRQSFNVLIAALLREGNTAKASEAADKAIRYLHTEKLAPSVASLQLADLLRAIGKNDDAKTITTHLHDYSTYEYNAGRNKEMNSSLMAYSSELLKSIEQTPDQRSVWTRDSIE